MPPVIVSGDADHRVTLAQVPAVTVAWVEEGCAEIRRAMLAGEHEVARALFRYISARTAIPPFVKARTKRRQGCNVTGCECLRATSSRFCGKHRVAV